MSLGWPDIAIAAIVCFGALKGFKKGFVAELSGAIALAAGLFAAFTYGGAWDGATETLTHLGAGSAHVVAMLAYAATAYLIVFVLGSVLSGIAKLPLIGIGNAVLGAAVGFAKATIFVWLVIYVALFFPLSREVRGDLHRSALVAILERPNPSIDGDLRRMMPWFVKPFAAELFARHRA